MTLLGKIFTVLVLCLSVLFMGLTIAMYATYENWYDQADLLNKQLSKAKTDRQELEARRDQILRQLTMERAARRQALSSLQSHLNELATKLDEMEKANESLVTTQREAIATMEVTSNHLVSLNQEVQALRKQVTTVQQDRDDKFARVVKLTDDLNQMKGLEVRLKERMMQLTDQLAQAKVVLDRNGLDINMPVGPPAVEGLVLEVGKNNLVEISIGRDDGLRAGHELDVSRGNRYLGRIIIVRTLSDRAVAEIKKDFSKGLIQKGDRVRTKV